jgi:hypothetical protein
VLRKLSDEIDKLSYANDARVRYSLRLNIGLLSGLAVGWFIKPGAGEAALVSLSPLALAFVAGYGSDLFFVALDKIVQAFAPTPGSGATTVKESTVGGITTTTVESRAATVAGRQDEPEPHPDPEEGADETKKLVPAADAEQQEPDKPPTPAVLPDGAVKPPPPKARGPADDA